MKTNSLTSRPPAFQFYPDDYLSDVNVELMSLEEQGAYMRLLCHAWKSTPVGTLLNDDEILAQLSRLGKEKWEQSKSKILRAFDPSQKGLIIQKRLVKEYEKQKYYQKQKVKAGKASAAKREQERQQTGNSCSSSVENTLQQNPTLHLQSSFSYLNNKNKEKILKKKKSVPDAIEITTEMEVWAKEKGVFDLALETEKFLDHHRAKGSLFLDWTAAWRTWMRNSAQFKTGYTPPRKDSLSFSKDPDSQAPKNPLPQKSGKYDHLYE